VHFIAESLDRDVFAGLVTKAGQDVFTSDPLK